MGTRDNAKHVDLSEILPEDRESERAWTSNIKTDFDKTKHLAETTIKQRKVERERIVREERDKEKEESNKKRLEEMQKNEHLKLLAQEDRDREEKKLAKALVASQRRMAREEKRKARTLRKMGLTEEEEMAERIGIEERKLLLAQRKLESIRILDELLERVKVKCSCLLSVVQKREMWVGDLAGPGLISVT